MDRGQRKTYEITRKKFKVDRFGYDSTLPLTQFQSMDRGISRSVFGLPMNVLPMRFYMQLASFWGQDMTPGSISTSFPSGLVAGRSVTQSAGTQSVNLFQI
jgi:hypothetical protein